MFFKNLAFLAIIFYVFNVFAQSNEITGSITATVIDKNSQNKIEYANVVLFEENDSVMVTGTITNSEGVFVLDNIKFGSYKLHIRFIGFNEQLFEININYSSRNVNLGVVNLEPAAVNIQDVVVEGTRSPISYQLDKKVIDVSQIQTSISGNAADVLENIPSITTDIDGNVSLRGSGSFTVLIDGRPSIMDAQDILQQIPASSIETIEIITNPSAKYDPEGTAGIINIVLKKTNLAGSGGIINANTGLNDKFGGDILYEYKNEFISSNIAIDYNRRFSPGTLREENRFVLNNNTSYLNTEGDRKWGRISYGIRAGLDFNLTENDILGFGLRYGSRDHQRNFTRNSTRWTSTNPTQEFIINRSSGGRSGDNFSFLSNYKKTFGGNKGHELTAQFNYEYGNSDEFSLNSEFQNNLQIGGKRTTETGPSTDIETKIDYVLPLTQSSKFEAGYKGEIDLSEETTGLYEFNINSGLYEFQNNFANNTKYDEREHSFYSIYSTEINNFGIQGGIRGEYTFRTIDVASINKQYSINRWDFFPSIHSSYKIAEGHQLMASYTRRIERPGGWRLEPFETWVDANNVRRGNPALDPEFIDSYEFGGQTIFGEIVFSTEVYYRVTKNKINDVRSVYAENITLNTIENIGTDYSLGSEFMFIFDPVKNWNINLMGNIYNYKMEGILLNESFSRESFNWRTRLSNNIKLSETTQLQLNINFNSPTISPQGRVESYSSSDIAIKQEFWQRKLTITLQARNVFGTAQRESVSQGLDFYRYNYSTRESPMLMLNLRFNFSNFRQDRERDGNRGGENGDDGGGGEDL